VTQRDDCRCDKSGAWQALLFAAAAQGHLVKVCCTVVSSCHSLLNEVQSCCALSCTVLSECVWPGYEVGFTSTVSRFS
jgi:hypothetical protein